MRQMTINDIGTDFCIAMGMLSKASLGLDKVIIENSQDTKASVARIGVLSEREMESGLQPVLICPIGIGRFISLVAKPRRIRFCRNKFRSTSFDITSMYLILRA